jgi:hypothetical protein
MRRIGIDRQFSTIYQDVGIDFCEIYPGPTLFERYLTRMVPPNSQQIFSGPV